MTHPILYLARHGETVYNRSGRMQGQHRDTPLTHAGIAQAHAMGEALVPHLGGGREFTFWCSTAGRAQQTAAIVAEHLGRDFFAIQTDRRLQEIEVGNWAGRSYAEIIASQGEIIDRSRRLFSVHPPAGESYADVAARLASWLHSIADATTPQLVISHGMAARVLRGMLVGGPMFQGIPIADDVPQGSLMRIEAGNETSVILGEPKSADHQGL